ncbi:MAG: cysteine desulfurase [Kiritimatiellaeota bacterium]|nr:cysteine desulfurase [Kiritimatiellota bacterium]
MGRPRREIYLDRNATGPVRREVAEAVRPFLTERFGNPSAPYAVARQAREHVRQARAQVAALLGCDTGDILFTGGGTESNNLAIKGSFLGRDAPDRCRIVTTTIEHPSVRESCLWLERHFGTPVTFVPVQRTGQVDPREIEAAMGPDVLLVSVMHANNETGVLQPVREVAEIAHRCGALFHVDGVQAVGKLPVNVTEIDCDFYSISAHKFGGLKGVGALYVRDRAVLAPLQSGGHQEGGLRAGTENVPGIAALGKAAEIAHSHVDENREKCLALRRIFDNLTKRIPMTRLNGAGAERLPNTTNLCCLYADAMSVVLALSVEGIYVGTGSACASHTQAPSKILRAMGLSELAAYCSIRISVGPELDPEDAEFAADTIVETVKRIRLVTAPEEIGTCDEDCPCFLENA